MTLCKKLIIAVSTLLLATAASADSAGNRDKSIALVGISPFGIHLATLATTPFKIGVFLGKDWMAGIDIGSGSLSASFGTVEATATYSNQGLYGRYFFGSSFNVLGGFHMRNSSGTLTATSGSTTSTLNVDAKANVLTLGIGNHWLLDWGLYVGADWLVLGAAMSKSSTASVTSTTGGGVSSAKTDGEKFGDLLNAISAASGAVVFTIGYAF
jgi:hypothetical protein